MTTPPDPEQHKRVLAGLFDRAADSYDSVGVDFFTQFGRHLVAVAGLRPGDVVLDAGCGRGAVTFPAAEAVGERGRVDAIDISPAMVALLRAAAPPNVTASVGDAESPEFPEGSFDAVLSGFVIFFLPDPGRALRAYRALLRPGGTLALSTFPGQPPGKWAEVGTVIQRHLPEPPPPGRPDQSPVAKPEGLAAALADVGFRDVRQATEEHEVVFRDLDHWWAWVWSHGQRGPLERIPADRLDETKADLYALLGADVAPGEPLVLRQRVTYTVATA